MKNKKKTNIILIGFMGSGKTSLGKLIAKELNLKFLDIDREIERNNGLLIKEIFNKFGEEYFRKLEKQEVIKIRNIKDNVISIGGGTFCSQENINKLKKIGLTVYLKADYSTLINRYTEAEISIRPLLQEPEKVPELLKTRELYYSQADLIIKTDNLTLAEVKDKLLITLPLSFSLREQKDV